MSELILTFAAVCVAVILAHCVLFAWLRKLEGK